MKEREIDIPTIALVAGTRLALGVGLGFLLADRLSPEQRRAAGWALFGLGVITTFPLVAEVFGAKAGADEDDLRVRRNPISPYVTTS
jgi:hypothetical protein